MGDIGPASQHLLTACRLLSGGAVTWLNRKDRGSKAGIGMVYLRELLFDDTHGGLHIRMGLAGMLPRHAGLLRFLDILGPLHIGRILAGQGKLRQSQRIGAVTGGLAGGNQFIRGGHGVMDLTDHPQHQILRQLSHLRPVLDVGAQHNLRLRICHAVRVKYSVGINIAVKMIFVSADIAVKLRGRGQHTLVSSSGRNGTGIHQCYGRNLAALQLGPLPVGEIPCRVADTEGIVGRGIPCAEARSAESGLHYRAGLQDGSGAAVFN